MSLTVGPISGVEHLAFVQFQRSVSFQQTPAWSRVKTVWRSESLGWYDGRRLVGAGSSLHRPVLRLERFTLAYLAEGPAIDWTGESTPGWTRSRPISRHRSRSRSGSAPVRTKRLETVP